MKSKLRTNSDLWGRVCFPFAYGPLIWWKPSREMDRSKLASETSDQPREQSPNELKFPEKVCWGVGFLLGISCLVLNRVLKFQIWPPLFGIFFKCGYMGGVVGVLWERLERLYPLFLFYLFKVFPLHFNPPLLFPLPVFCWVFMDNDGKLEPKDSWPLMSCFKDISKVPSSYLFLVKY